jgi:ABC-2 type transport system ATP-binding protein
MSPPATVLEVRNLVKHYPGVKAVDGVGFSIREGTCFGLLGPNGAGKTTTIEMIEGITKPTSGEILYRGVMAGGEFKERIGIQFQKTALQDYLTVREVLELFRSLYKHKADLERLRDLCRLEEFWDRDHEKLSGGQKQRLLLALALVNEPDVVFLDEPTTGLDPQARRNFWDLVQTIKAEKRTIVLTTHYMEEAYVLCDEIAIMDHGKIIAQGEPKSLLKQHFGTTAVELPRADLPVDPKAIPWPSFEHDGLVEIQTDAVNDTLRYLLEAKANLAKLTIRSPNLEDLFLALTGKEIRH